MEKNADEGVTAEGATNPERREAGDGRVWDAEMVDRVCRHKKRGNAVETESDPLNV